MKKTKTKVVTIGLILIITLAATLIASQLVTAQSISDVKTYTFVAPPSKAAVSQPALLVYWLNEIPTPETDEEIAAGLRGGYTGVTLTITKPDTTTETIEMPRSDPVGSGYTSYTPIQTGTYSVQAHFPGNWRNTTTEHAWYMPSESAVRTFEVQQEPVAGWPEAPLPNDYWMRPISGASHSWSEVASHWLGFYAQVYPQGASGGATTNYVYGDAPDSPHILWTHSIFDEGSIVSERFGTQVYTLNHYHSVDFPSIIVDGKIHYELYRSAHYPGIEGLGSGGWGTLSLYTGNQLRLDYGTPPPDFGQVYLYNSPNQHGAFNYLWRTSNVTLPEVVYLGRSGEQRNTTTDPIDTGTLWEMIDAFTGNSICYVANVSSGGSSVYGKDGSLTYYDVQNYGTEGNPDYYLQIWNSSAITSMLAGDTGTTYWMWRPAGGANGANIVPPRLNVVHDGSTGWSLNVSIPLDVSASMEAVREGEYVIFGNGGWNDNEVVEPAYFVAFSLEDGHKGEMLWETEFTPPYADTWASGFPANGMGFTTMVPEEEVIVYSDNIQLKRYAFDMMSGEKLWESEREDPWKFYNMEYKIYNDMLLSGGKFSGDLIAYNLRTGEKEWTYLAPLEGTESPYGRGTMDVGAAAVADGKIYLPCTEHSASSPLWRQPGLRCLDLETGELLWDILFWGGGQDDLPKIMVADSILIGFNLYDGQVYAFGRGPSATTVTAPDTEVPLGTSIVIQGTVTDQTPTGRRNINNEMQFTLKDTPAISDEDMSAWMEYMFMQQEKPEDAKGVEVVVTTLDPNGNTYEIGRTISDATGAFNFAWEPLDEGYYIITAAFEGSASYGPSSATTAITVGPEVSPGIEPTTEPPTTAPPTTAPPTGEAPLITTEVAIIAGVVIIAVIAIAAYWVLRRRQVK
jgi:hypothetical protein